MHHKLKEFGANEVIEYNGVEENVKFNLPKEISYMKRVNLTKHRKTIYNIIFNSGEHLSADEIIAILKRKDLKFPEPLFLIP